MGLLDSLIYGLRTVLENGTAKPLRSAINLIGATITDNPGADRLDVNIFGSGILPKVTLSDQAVAPAPTAAAVVLGSSAGVLSCVSPEGASWTFGAAAGTATTRKSAHIFGAPVRTADETPATLLSIPIPLMSILEAEVQIMGLRSDGTGAAWDTIIVRAYRGSGAPFGPALKSVVVDDDGIGGHSIAMSAATSAVVLTITGPAEGTVKWLAAYRVITFTP